MKLTEELFKKTERLLYNHYRAKKNINKLENEINALTRKKAMLMRSIKENKVTLNEDLKAICYDRPSIQSSSDGTSSAEQQWLKQIELMERETMHTSNKIIKNRARIIEIEFKISRMDNIITPYDEETKRFIELKYAEGASINKISYILHLAKSTAQRKRNEIIEIIAEDYFGLNFLGQKWVKVGTFEESNSDTIIE